MGNCKTILKKSSRSKQVNFIKTNNLRNKVVGFILYLLIDTSANSKLGSINILDSFTFLKDLYANIAIGISVHPNIIFLQFF